MSDAKLLVQEFLVKQKKEAEKKEIFPHSSFRSLFDVKEIDQEEKTSFYEKLPAFFANATQSEELFLFQMTAELRSIQKQAVILVGERIFRIREMFQRKKLGDLVFSKWLSLTFASKKTAYNALSLYEFFQQIPEEGTREKVKTLPLKAMYILASRKGSLKKKCEIVNRFEGKRQHELILEIQKAFPIHEADGRKKHSSFTSLMLDFDALLDRLDRKPTLNGMEKRAMRARIRRLKAFLEKVEG